MATALYIVIQSQGRWFVDFEGKAHGPFGSREAAALEGKQLAQFTAHIGRPAQVLVPDSNNKYWVVWDSRDVESGIARPVAGKPTQSPVFTPRKDAA
jgi:hypothetical protein